MPWASPFGEEAYELLLEVFPRSLVSNTVAVVGPAGSGKTTLVNTLFCTDVMRQPGSWQMLSPDSVLSLGRSGGVRYADVVPSMHAVRPITRGAFERWNHFLFEKNLLVRDNAGSESGGGEVSVSPMTPAVASTTTLWHKPFEEMVQTQRSTGWSRGDGDRGKEKDDPAVAMTICRHDPSRRRMGGGCDFVIDASLFVDIARNIGAAEVFGFEATGGPGSPGRPFPLSSFDAKLSLVNVEHVLERMRDRTDIILHTNCDRAYGLGAVGAGAVLATQTLAGARHRLLSTTVVEVGFGSALEDSLFNEAASCVLQNATKVFCMLPATRFEADRPAFDFLAHSLARSGRIASPSMAFLQPVLSKLDLYSGVHLHGQEMAIGTSRKGAQFLHKCLQRVLSEGGNHCLGEQRVAALPLPLVAALDGVGEGFTSDRQSSANVLFGQRSLTALHRHAFDSLSGASLCGLVSDLYLSMLRRRTRTLPRPEASGSAPSGGGTVPLFASLVRPSGDSAPNGGVDEADLVEERIVANIGREMRCKGF